MADNVSANGNEESSLNGEAVEIETRLESRNRDVPKHITGRDTWKKGK